MKTERDDYTAEEIRQMLHYAPETGVFTWRHRATHPRKWNSRYAGKTAGTKGKTGYVYIEIRKGLPTQAARIAWLYVTGKWPPRLVDHRNGIRDDNRWENLRLADYSENGANKARQSNNTSGYTGVSFDRQRSKWHARINFRGKMHDVGFFDTAEAGAEARRAYEERLTIHGEFTPEGAERPRYFHHRDVKDE